MIINANMHWLPENLFKDKFRLSSFINCVFCAYGENARVALTPGKRLLQIIREKPR